MPLQQLPCSPGHNPSPAKHSRRICCTLACSIRSSITTQWSAQHHMATAARYQQCQLLAPACMGSNYTIRNKHRARTVGLHTPRPYCLATRSEGNSSSSSMQATTSAQASRSQDVEAQRSQCPPSEVALAAAEAIAAAAEAAAQAEAAAMTGTAVGTTNPASSASAALPPAVHPSPTGTTHTAAHGKPADGAAAGNSSTSNCRSSVADGADSYGFKQLAASRAAEQAAASSVAGNLEQAWQEAVQAVSASSGVPVAIVSHQMQLLRLLLPDLDQTLAAKRAALQQWEAVGAALQLMQPAGGSVDWAKDEAVIMDMVMTAISCSERDGSDAYLHNSLCMAIANFFSAVRCYGQFDPDLQRQQWMLLSQLQQCIAMQRERAAQLMHQQVMLAATTEQLPEKLISLKDRLAAANVSQLVVRHPALLRHQPDRLRELIVQAELLLQPTLGHAEAVLLLEAEPWLLEPGALQGCIEGFRELFPAKEPCSLLLQHVRTGGSKLLAEFRQQALALHGLAASGTSKGEAENFSLLGE